MDFNKFLVERLDETMIKKLEDNKEKITEQTISEEIDSISKETLITETTESELIYKRAEEMGISEDTLNMIVDLENGFSDSGELYYGLAFAHKSQFGVIATFKKEDVEVSASITADEFDVIAEVAGDDLRWIRMSYGSLRIGLVNK